MHKYNAKNERIKRQYLAYLREAKRQSESSVDAVAAALAPANRPAALAEGSEAFADVASAEGC